MDVVYDDVRSPGSFGGIRNLMRYSDRSEREVKTFLSGRDAYCDSGLVWIALRVLGS